MLFILQVSILSEQRMDTTKCSHHEIEIQSSSDYPAPDTPAIPIQRHFFEMIRSEKKKCKCLVYSSLSVSVPGAINFKF